MSDQIIRYCEHCKQLFTAERISRRYCSDSCRQLAYLDRRSRKISNAYFVEDAMYEPVQEVVVTETELNNDSSSTVEEIQEVTPVMNGEPESASDNKLKNKYRKKATKANNNAIDPRLVYLGGLLLEKFLQKVIGDEKSAQT